MPTGVQRLVGIAKPRRGFPPGARRRKGGSNRTEKDESRDGNPGLHEPEPTEFRLAVSLREERPARSHPRRPGRRPSRAERASTAPATTPGPRASAGSTSWKFHEALLDADTFEDLPGEWQAAIIKAEWNRPKLPLASGALPPPDEARSANPCFEGSAAASLRPLLVDVEYALVASDLSGIAIWRKFSSRISTTSCYRR